MKLKEIVKKTVVLTLDKRLSIASKVIHELYNIHLRPQLFLVGNGSLGKEMYDHIDVNELPPVYSNSIQYPTWWARPNAYNAFLSHQKILKEAVKENVDNVLIVEDDAFLEDDFEDIAQKAFQFLNKNDWDMIYFGGYHRPGSWSKTANEYVIKLNGSGGWHGVLIHKDIVNELLTFPAIGPYDWICGEYLHSIYNCYAIFPSIISQRDRQFSYVEGTELTKPSRFIR